MKIYAQFRRPTGWLGRLVGLSMGVKNASRSRWVLGLLAARPGERVLEVGFGAGADIARLLDAVGPGGVVVGIDASEVMVHSAAHKNRRAAAEGRLFLRHADIADAFLEDGTFDAVYSVNCAQFWPDLAAGFEALRKATRVGGRAVVAVQPKHRDAVRADSERWLRELGAAAASASWAVEGLELGSERVPTAAVLLRREAG
ncbi:MAG: methyltransferase domain-containing protein [Polyangiaceae bacterium]